MLALLMFLVSLLLAEVNILPEHRVPNRTGSQCVFSSLETIGRHFGIASLYDLTACYKGTSGPDEANGILNSRGVKCYWSREGRHDWQSLKNAMAWHWPAAVGLDGTHMLLLVDVTETSVKVIDNCGPKKLQVQEWSRQWFDQHWDGSFLVIPSPESPNWHRSLLVMR